jgi:hypothetical protein
MFRRREKRHPAGRRPEKSIWTLPNCKKQI